MTSWGSKHVPAEWPQDAHIFVHNLTMAYGSLVIQRTLPVQRGDIFIIMGGSGVAKARCYGISLVCKPQPRGTCCTTGRVSGRSSRPSANA